MTLRELIDCLRYPCHTHMTNPMEMEVMFNTSDRSSLMLLSCYVHKDKVHIDIGEEDE